MSERFDPSLCDVSPIWRATLDDVAQVNAWNERDIGHPVDFSEFLSNPQNVCLICGEGGALFAWRGPHIYEVHCFFAQRGKEVRDISAAILRIMADFYGANLVWAAIPDESRKVKTYVRWLGFRSIEHAVLPHGPCEVFTWEPDTCRQQ